MIGNAVPVKMAQVLGQKIFKDLQKVKKVKLNSFKKSETEFDGTVVKERMNELINSISA